VPKDDDLQIRLSYGALARPEQTEQTAQQEVEDRPDHGGGLSQMTVQPPFCDPDPVSGPHGLASNRTPAYGTGLQGVADRLAAIDASLEVRSRPGSGTTIVGIVPIQRPP
jgi:hypothetical protein